MTTRDAKFRQAAFTYLHVAILYEVAAYVMWKRGMLPTTRMGPGWLWLLLGAAIAGVVVWALLKYRNPWLPRAIWAIHALRLPALVEGAFFRGRETTLVPPAFYIVAIVVVVINLWMLARAGWDV